MQLHLGQRRAQDTPVELPAHALLRHMMALGSSGSGKTVLCKIVVEEAVRCGVPVICIDPQGDLCSLALASAGTDESALSPDGPTGGPTDGPGRAFAERADVVVFTPASRRGVPLCADPLHGSIHDLPAADKVQALSRAADMIVSLLGYDGDSDDGAGLRAVIDTALADMDAAGRPAHRLRDLTDFMTGSLARESSSYERFLDARKLRTACQRMARLEVGARRLLFHEGLPVDIDMLLGRGDSHPDRTRVSVIYLNTLHSQDDKDFFVATLVERLYEWMLRHPSADLQALFYIDEIAPFMPPVRKPACKAGLQLLFKQARKYGVGCMMATQNPGDVDYKAMAQFGTWALGRLTTRQDIKKIAPVIKATAGSTDADDILADLPARKPGEFTVLAPDHFPEPVALATRWLYSAHETLDDARIERLTDERWRDRFAALERAARPAPTEKPPAQTLPAAKPPAAKPPAAKPPAAKPPAAKPPTAKPPAAKTEAKKPPAKKSPAKKPPAAAASPEAANARSASRKAARTEDDPGRELERLARVLAELDSASAREFADKAGVGEKKARRLLQALVEAGHARAYRQGRGHRYFARARGIRPDLGLADQVAVIRPAVDEARARAIANSLRRTAFLGLWGEDETLVDVQLIYRPVYQVVFSETVPRTGLSRLLGFSEDHLMGTVYHHPQTLQLLCFTDRRGIEFLDEVSDYASRIDDFDGFARFDDVPPGSIAIDEDAWRERRGAAEVEGYFRERFAAQPSHISPVFVPLWQIHLRQTERGNVRLLSLDGLVGKPVSWPPG